MINSLKMALNKKTTSQILKKWEKRNKYLERLKKIKDKYKTTRKILWKAKEEFNRAWKNFYGYQDQQN